MKRRRSIRRLPVSFNKSLPSSSGKGWWKSIIELEKIGWKISLFSVTLTADDDSGVERRLYNSSRGLSHTCPSPLRSSV